MEPSKVEVVENIAQPTNSFDHKKITLEEIKNATNNFGKENLIREGGFGKVYKGKLVRSEEIIDIAARRLHYVYGQGDMEFWKEISVFASDKNSLHHENLVSFIGFCYEKGVKIIVYKLEARGSLDTYLSDPETLPWITRLHICVGLARALKYIHDNDGHDSSIIHRNIKSSKILLDDNWNPKLSGFEHCKINTRARKNRLVLDEIIGTIGYVDPSYEKTGFVTHKSDIFSLGVVLFEILCGRRAFTPDEQEMSSPQFSRQEDDEIPDYSELYTDDASPTASEKRRSFGQYPPGLSEVWRGSMSFTSDERQMRHSEKRWPERRPISGGIEGQSMSFTGENPNSFAEIYERMSLSYNYLQEYEPPLKEKENENENEKEKEKEKEKQKEKEKEKEKQKENENEKEKEKQKQKEKEKENENEKEKEKKLSFRQYPSGGIPSIIHRAGQSEEQEMCPLSERQPISGGRWGPASFSRPSNRAPSCSEAGGDSKSFTPDERQMRHSPQLQSTTSEKRRPERQPTVGGIKGQSMSFTGENPKSFAEIYSRRISFNEIHRRRNSTNISLQESQPALKEKEKEKEKPFKLHPGFTMKKLDQYSHSQTEVLLYKLAKTHYEEGKLDDLISKDLLKNMDPESYKIFSGTAYNCLSDQRAQRPNIDKILRNLVKALQLQMKREHPGLPIAAEGTPSSDSLKGGKLDYLKIPLMDIELATDNFTKIFLGAGAYGKVYGAELEVQIEGENKGELPPKQKKVVAIKCIKKSKQGEEGFIREIELLTRCEHPNIVSLLGFCNEGDELILVYEHLSNGSLDNYLGTSYNSNNLTWVQRLKISIDIAKGLNYLHTKGEDEHSIIHRDVKSGNILLGKNWTAKIADFGLSKFHDVNGQEKTHYSNIVAGTKVYMCPEYMKDGKLKRAIDIYSFGVVLFEILSGKVAHHDFSYLNKENQHGIAHIARELYEQQKINRLVDPQIMEEVDELTSSLYKGPNPESLATFIEIAYKCVAVTQNARPVAEEILKELQNALLSQEKNKHALEMSFQEIRSATKNFRKYIGGGGFGRVYEGEIIHGDKHNTVVAKRLDRKEGQGDREFLTELEILLEYKHENIIALAGYCKEKNERIIVYEHASKGSLDRHLKNTNLKWTERLRICIDVARGLAFLHGGALTREMVIHRDIKCANILLNDDWKAKISDFGLSAITAIDQEVLSDLVGTRGYVDPEYDDTGFFTNKSDIYSFGVVLFEVLSGEMLVPNTKNYSKQRAKMVLMQIHKEEKIHSIVFKDIMKDIVPQSLSAFRAAASRCLDNDRKKRPTAEEVLLLLQKALELQLAP